MKYVSVIVPIYNTQKSDVEKCIDSILCQTYCDYEVLLIDDGSNDECALMLDGMVRKDVRIKVYHQINQGVSAARNYGMAQAKGEYLTFVDSDDIVSPYMLEEAMHVITETDADLVLGAVRVISGEQKITFIKNESLKYEGIEADKKKELQAHNLDLSVARFRNIQGGKITRGPIARVVRTKLAAECRFQEGICIGEDSLWNHRLFDLAEKIEVVNSCWYGYVQHAESVTHKFNINLEEHIRKKMIEIKKNILSEKPYLQKNYDNLLCEEISSNYVAGFLMHPECPYTFLEKKAYLKKILHKEPFSRLKYCPIYWNKTGIKIIMMRTNFIFIFYKIKRWIYS